VSGRWSCGARVAIHAFTKDTEELLGDAPTAVLG